MAYERVLGALQRAFLVLGLLHISAAYAEPFDKPLQKKIVDLGRSKFLMPTDNRHVTLTCSYYSDFMIKQLDDPGEKGAAYIALLPIQPGESAKCTRKLDASEKRFGRNCAYFIGVKRNLVWIDDCDGTNGGLGFTIFDSKTMTRLFRDARLSQRITAT